MEYLQRFSPITLTINGEAQVSTFSFACPSSNTSIQVALAPTKSFSDTNAVLIALLSCESDREDHTEIRRTFEYYIRDGYVDRLFGADVIESKVSAL